MKRQGDSSGPIAAALGLALSAALALSPGSKAEEPDLTAMLQDVDRNFDRHELPADVRFRGEDGLLTGGVRCATRPVADFERRFIAAAISERLDLRGTDHRDRTITIPVVLHVLRKNNGDWNVTDAQIADQIEVLNRAFEGHGFEFVLEDVNRKKKNRFAKKCLKERIEAKFKKRFSVDPATTLNIYTCRPGDRVLGYATLPADYPESSFLHGVVLLHSSLPGGSAAPFDLGDTAVHEVGHYLGLFHTFEGRCSGTGDLVSDTPAEKKPASGCPVGRDTCPSPGLDPVTNFMDYSDDDCVEEFTPEQVFRMKDQVATFKPSLD